MSANELVEALQAIAWVQMSGALGLLTEGGVNFRSQCGFQQRVIASEDLKDFGLLIFLLERTHSRRESAIVVTPIGTTADSDTYPQPSDSTTGQLENPTRAPAIQPIMLSWLGPDLANPNWLPFEGDTLPADVNPDHFDAIAVLQPANNTGATLAGDFCLALYRMPPLPEGTSITLETVLPVPVVP